METTANQTQVREKVQAEKVSVEGKISRRALLTFISGAVIVFAIAIYYCWSTGHKAEAGILTGAIAIIGVLAASTYKSFK